MTVVSVVLLNEMQYVFWHQSLDALSFFHFLSYLRARHVDKWSMEGTSIALTRIDRNVAGPQNVLPMVPPLEMCPVIATQNQRKATVGIVLCQRLQRMPRIAGLR